MCSHFSGEKQNWETMFGDRHIEVCVSVCVFSFTPVCSALDQEVKKSTRNAPTCARKQNNCATTFKHRECKRYRAPALCCLVKNGKRMNLGQHTTLQLRRLPLIVSSFPHFLRNLKEVKLSNCQRSLKIHGGKVYLKPNPISPSAERSYPSAWCCFPQSDISFQDSTGLSSRRTAVPGE